MSESSEKTDTTKRGDKRGILRVDLSKPRNSSGSVEFRNQPELFEASPSPQSTQLSVKWAFSKDSKVENASDVQVRSGSSERRAKKSLSADYFGFQPCYDQFFMESIEAPEYINSEDELDEDYSLSLSAVIQRRASVRGRKKGYYSPRRASSPMGHVSGVCGIPAANSNAVSKADRRRSSVYTTSSGETVVSLGEGANNMESTKEQIFENIRLHKEVLQSVKMQPWSMRRKLRLVRQARAYIARHEGALQERFAMSRSTKDLWARFKIVVTVKWQHFRRELVNLSTLFVPWQLRIKEIESHFGSVVASYFTFLRWLFWVNIVLAFTLSTFVILPEFISSNYGKRFDDHRKNMLAEEHKNATRLTTFLNFEGYLKYSPLFYGYYSDYSGMAKHNYNLPLAYFFAGVSVYIYSFWATLRKMADNSRMSKMSSKEDECIFSWKLFTGWDYMIGHAETAHNRIASVVLSFKEALLEEAEKKKDKQNWEIIVRRIFVNILILCLLVLSATAVVIVVDRSTGQTKDNSYWRQNETSFVMTGISFFFPTCFEILGLLEKYHPRKQLRWQLGRIMMLNLLNLFSLIIALFKKINSMNEELDKLRRCGSQNDTTETTIQMITSTVPSIIHAATSELLPAFPDLTSIATTMFSESIDSARKCPQLIVNCSKLTKTTTKSMMITILALNFTTTILPEITNQLNGTEIGDVNFSTTMDYFNLTDFDEYNETTTDDLWNTTFDFSSTTEFDFTTDGNNLRDITNLVTSTSTTTTTTTTVKTEVETDDSAYSDEYADEDYNNDDPIASELRVRRQIDESYNTTDDQFNFNTTGFDTDNMTEWISSTVQSFLENTTITLDPYNETTISEQWSTYLTTISTDDTDETDENDENDEDDEIDPRCIDNPMGFYLIDNCDDTDMESTISYTTYPNEITVAPDSSKIPATVMDIVAIITTPATNDSLPLNATSVVNSKGKSEKKKECVPFMPNRGDNITGIPPEYVGESLSKTIQAMSQENQKELRSLCWETLFGQELVKLTVLDLIFTIFATLFMDFFRALFVRFMNKCWCWDLEKKFPKYGDFKIAENILHLVNNQGQVWMGMFFAPGLALLNLVKLGILMYFRSWAVLTCNVPHEVIFRASRSNNFYLALLLTMLFLCVLPVSYAIVWIEPSWHCGPFAHHARIHRVFTDTLKSTLPKNWHTPMDIIASPSTVIPLLLLLILIIYYLLSLTSALREANQDLKNQLRRERQEERRKMLQRVVNAKLDDSGGNNAIDRWRKVLEASSPVTPNAPGQPVEPDEEKIKARREILARLMKKALRKSSNTSDDESHVGDDGDETDTEQHEQLPHDHDTINYKRTPVKRKRSSVNLLEEPKVESAHQQPRKLSFTRMKDIVEVSRRKSDQMKADEMKIMKSKVIEENGADKRKKKDEPPKNHDDENYNKMNVVSERRALRRQQNARESESGLSLQPIKQDALNFDLVNERNKNVEKPAKTKPPPLNTCPQIIQIDTKVSPLASLARECNSSKEADESDTERNSFKETVAASNKSKPQLSKDSSGSVSKNTSPTTSFQVHSPDDQEIAGIHPEVVDQPKKGQIKPSSPLPSPQNSPSPSEKFKQTDDVLNKPIRKFNSFLALVKEAVQAKKQEQQQEHTEDAYQTSHDIQFRVKTFIDDSTSVSMSESTKTTTESTNTSSKNTTYFESIRRKRHSEPPKPKRQDSQASIWSENIPVITISKSESDECILEKDNDELESLDSKTAK